MGRKPRTIDQLCEELRRLRSERGPHETFEQQRQRRERMDRLDREMTSRYAWLNSTIDNYRRMASNAAFDPFLSDLLEQRRRCDRALKEANSVSSGLAGWQWEGFR